MGIWTSTLNIIIIIKQVASFSGTYTWLSGCVFVHFVYMYKGYICVLSTCLLFHQNNCFFVVVVETLLNFFYDKPLVPWDLCSHACELNDISVFLVSFVYSCMGAHTVYSISFYFHQLILLCCRFSSDWDNHQQPSHSERSWKMPGHRIPTWTSTLLERPGWIVGYSTRGIWALWYLLSNKSNWRLVCVFSSNKTSAYYSRYSGGPQRYWQTWSSTVTRQKNCRFVWRIVSCLGNISNGCCCFVVEWTLENHWLRSWRALT